LTFSFRSKIEALLADLLELELKIFKILLSQILATSCKILLRDFSRIKMSKMIVIYAKSWCTTAPTAKGSYSSLHRGFAVEAPTPIWPFCRFLVVVDDNALRSNI
jgi:hypothetical protein